MAQKYIVRADRAGVFFGEIESRTGSEVAYELEIQKMDGVEKQ